MLLGRERELAVLDDALERAERGVGSIHLVLGEAGLGKSTLLAALAGRAAQRGLTVLPTRCSPDPTAPALWPWSVLLRAWAAERDPGALAERLGRVHPLVRRLAPEVAGMAGLEVPPGPADELEGRYAVADGLGRLLGADGPALVLVEDLHHADAGSLAMAEPVAVSAAAAGVAVVASARGRGTASGVASAPGSVTLDLALLGQDEALALVAATAPGIDPATATQLAERAAGNPFFLTELARLTASPAGHASTPRSVQDVARHRVEALGPEAVEVLEVAALLGAHPDVDLLARVVGRPDVVDATVDRALDADLLVAEGADLRWAHDLIREALVDATGASRRRRIHDRVATALLVGDREVDPRILAHHLLASGVRPVEAADAGEAAARRSAQGSAHEDVIAWVDRTRPAAGRSPDAADRAARLDHLSGRAHVGLSSFARGRALLVAAAERFLATGDVEEAIDALLAIGTGRLRGTEDVDPPVELIDRALAAVGDRDDLRSRLLGRRSDLAPTKAGSVRLAEEAVDAARACGRPEVLVQALGRQLITWRAGSLEGRWGQLREIEALGDQVSGERRFEILAYRCLLHVEQGDLDDLERLLPQADATVLRLGLARPLASDFTATLVDLLRGRFDEAEQRLDALVADARRGQEVETMATRGLQVALIRVLRGDLGSALADAEVYLGLASGTPLAVQVHCVRAMVAAAAGRLDLARQSVDEVFRVGLDALAEHQFEVGTALLPFVAEALWALRDGARAEELERVLLPWEGRTVAGGMAPSIAFGAADHQLGLLADARGDRRLARRRLAEAVRAHRRMGAPPMLARSLVVEAALAAGDGDAAVAEASARESGHLAARYGLRVVGEQAATILASLGAAPVPGVRVGGAPVALVFTDIESSTATAAALGDEAWLVQLRTHDAVVRRLVARHGGREVKHLGDGFLLAFPSTGAAVDFARDLQPALADGPVRVRVGIHTGPVVEEEGDVFGTTVNVAARVAGAAAGGEVLVTDAVRSVLPDLDVGRSRTVELKGVAQPMAVHALA